MNSCKIVLFEKQNSMELCNSNWKVKMTKRFRLRLSSAVTKFHSCRPEATVAPLHRNMSAGTNLFSSPSTSGEASIVASSSSSSCTSSPCPLSYSHIMRQLATVFSSMGCGSAKSCSSFIPVRRGSAEEAADKLPENYFQWLKDEKWLVVAKLRHEGNDDSAHRRKIYLDSTPLFPRPLLSEDTDTERNKRKKHRRQKTVERKRLVASSSSSSSRHDDDAGYCDTSRRRAKSDYENDESSFPITPPRLSRFQWLIPCAVEGKVRESFAVVKKSDDPYEDFKKSMLEMVVEKRMFEREDLERLLNCFLSLNSEDHHEVIVEAFSEIWRTLFPS